MNVIDGILQSLRQLTKRVERLEVGEHSHPLITVPDATELTIAAGVVTRTQTYHTIDTQADAATDDLDTINGGVVGDILIIQAADSTRDVVAKDGTGNLKLAGDFTMDHVLDSMMLIYVAAGAWVELSRSDNV